MTSTPHASATPPDAGGADAALAALLFDTEAVGVALVDAQLRYVRVNAALARMNGAPAEAHVGRPVRAVLGDEAADALEPMLRQVLASGEPVVDLPIAVPDPARGSRHFLASYRAVRDAGGAPTAIVGVVAEHTDATRRAHESERAARAAADAERERLDRIIAGIPVPVAVLEGRELRFRALSAAYAQIVGGRDVVGRPIREALPELSGEGGTDFFALLDRVYETGQAEVRSNEFARWDTDGDGVAEDHVVDLVYAPLRARGADDAAGAVEGVLVLVLDVTARTHAEAARRESEARFRNVADAAPVMLWVTEADGRCTFLSRAWFAFTGQTPEQGLGFGWLDAVHPDDRPGTERVFRGSAARGAPFRFEYRLRRHDGEYRWCIDAAAPRIAEDGTYFGYVGSVVDVHERVVGEARLTALFEQAPVFIGVMRGPQHVYELSNAEHDRYVGGGREILGKPVLEALPELRGQGFVEKLDHVLATGEPYVGTAVPVQLRRAPGAPLEESFVDFVYAPLTEPDGTRSGVVAIGSDITARVHAERARVAAREAADLERRRLDTVLAALPVGVIVIEAPSGRVVYFNEALRRIWGRAATTQRLEEYSVEWHGYHVEDGRATERPYASHEWPVARALVTGEPVLDEVVAAAHPDGTRPMVSISAVPIRDADGQLVGAAAVLVDVEAQHQARSAIDAARTAAEQANRAKSEFLAVMSHELRTPLNAIQGYAELMELGIHGPVTPPQQDALRRIQASQRHLLGLVNGVLNYARVETGNVHYALADVPLDAVLTTCESLVATQARAKDIALAMPGAADGRPLVVRADAEKVQQIVLNLLSNAVKFTEPGGRVTLWAEVDRDAVRIVVQDTGIGIAPEQLERIFEPFVQVDARLTRPHEGVGLGLAISRDLARGMGGELAATSAPGAGSTFTLTLPRGG